MDLIITSHNIKELHYIDQAIHSVSHITFEQKIIIFDGLPNGSPDKHKEQYDFYKHMTRLNHPDFTHIHNHNNIGFLKGVKDTINTICKTPWIFLVQGDVCFEYGVKINLTEIINSRPVDADILYFSHKKLKVGSNGHWYHKVEDVSASWQKTLGWSERVFMFDRCAMIDNLNQYNHKHFIEYICHRQCKCKGVNLDDIWNLWRCYCYKDVIHKHLVGHTIH